jgi:hypothetical protein
MDPNISAFWEERAKIRFARQAFAEAAADYQQAIAINPAVEPILAPRLREARSRASGDHRGAITSAR